MLLCLTPQCFSCIVDLLVFMHSKFAEWDVNLIPANIKFCQPQAALAFGKVSNMFLSRPALQNDSKRSIKVAYVGGYFFINEVNCFDFQNRDAPPDELFEFSPQQYASDYKA